ncbi:MAG: putative Ig domain-containing protein [Gemmatimonadetes bacterium]|nr:putative Ig domain-containing protein [Gemmatimonadota bacterium]
MSVDYRHRVTHRHGTRGALRLALSISALTAVASWVVGCDEPQSPVAQSIKDLTVEVGSTESVDLAAYFSDPDGDELTYTASSSNTGIATVSVSGATAQVTGVAAGSATVDVTATDPGGLSADQTFTVTVPNRAPVAGEPIEDIDVVVGEAAQVDVSGNFSDPDGDALTYTATPSDTGVATASVSGSAVTVSGVSLGTANVRVTATDPGGLSATQAFTVTVRSADRAVLEILYDELDGDNWTNNTNWKTDRPIDEWYGVGTGAGGRVDTLNLRDNSRGDNSLRGEIPSELSEMSNLEFLDLSLNEVTGEIPSELGELSNLVVLVLTSNLLTGEIPPELAELPNLGQLSLDGNELTGEIPPELAELPNLEFLGLGGNSLVGGIPPELGELSNLEVLYLGGNSLTGEIPPELGDLSNLEWLALHANSLTGEIPPELAELSNLEQLSLYHNSLTGAIPPELGKLSNLEQLHLEENQLTGGIPPELGNLSNLGRLYLGRNSLTGEIPPEFLDLSLLWLFSWFDNDGLCAPDTREFDDWLDGITWNGPRCD